MNATTQLERLRITQPPPPSRPRAGRRGWIVGPLVLAGLALAIWWGVASYLGMIDRIADFRRVPIPSSETIVLERGTQVLSVEAGRLAPIPDIRFVVVTPDGGAVPVQPYEGELRYDVPDAPGRLGRAVATFEADAPGAFTIDVVGPGADGAVVAIGEDAARAALPSILGALGLLSVSALGGLFLLVRRLVAGRGRAAR